MILQRRRDSPDTDLHFVGLDGAAEHSTLGRFLDEALLLATSLHAHGLRTGDIVAIRGANTLPYSRAVVASLLAGLTTLPLVSLLGDSDVEQVLALSGANLLLSERTGPKRPLTEHLAALAAAGSPGVALIGDGVPVPGTITLPRSRDQWPADQFPAKRTAPAFLLYTSGTTGVPRGVLHGYDSILAEVLDWSTSTDLADGGHVFEPFPLGHIAGLDSLLVSVCLGRDLTMISTWDAAIAADALEAYGATAAGSTPFYASTLFDEFDRRGTTRTSLSTLQSGGGAVGSQLVRRAEKYGIRMARAYGSTEHPSATACRSGESLAERADTDGCPTGGSEVRIVDDAGIEVAEGGVGEVQLRGPEQFLGYLDGGTDSFAEDGWFRTGDLGRLSGGRLTITGRKKDIIIRGGENISVVEVEQILSGCPGVEAAAVIGVPDERYGERMLAFVVRSSAGPEVDLESVRAHFTAAGVARHKIPEWVREIDDLPRNALGKVQKHLLPVGDGDPQIRAPSYLPRLPMKS